MILPKIRDKRFITIRRGGPRNTAVMAASSKDEKEVSRLRELAWQREKLPEQIRELVIDDERLRNDICWFVFGEKQ